VVDKLTPDQRSAVMSRVRTRDTEPELIVRKLLHSLGYRFRLAPQRLPGKPDVVLPKYKAAIFIHGCFWHGHKGCARGARPASNTKFWNQKIDGNIRRDRKVQQALKSLGWRVLVLWQCRTTDMTILARRITGFLDAGVAGTHDPNAPTRLPKC
jgi:DNA mismatch endonuclease, patch repair protein